MRTKNPGVMEALRELKEMNLGKILRAEWDDIQKARADQRAREDYVRDEGRLLGRDEGIQEGVLLTVRNMLKHNVPEKDILTFSGCTKEQLDAAKATIQAEEEVPQSNKVFHPSE